MVQLRLFRWLMLRVSEPDECGSLETLLLFRELLGVEVNVVGWRRPCPRHLHFPGSKVEARVVGLVLVVSRAHLNY